MRPVTGLPRLTGRTCLVTGASAGIGKETARGLAGLGARVVMACRNLEKGDAVRHEIVASTGNPDVDLMQVDLASQGSIRSFVPALLAKHPRLEVLVNNAGIWAASRRESSDGIELTWATNVLGYYRLTELLLDALKATGSARVVNVASLLARDLDLTDVEFRRRRYSGVTAYAQSKQADRMLTWALARRLSGTTVTANAMHPGGVSTELFGKGGGLVAFAASIWAKLFARSATEGAETVVWLAAASELEGVSGRFWIDRQEARCRYRDEAEQERLWLLCGEMTQRTA